MPNHNSAVDELHDRIETLGQKIEWARGNAAEMRARADEADLDADKFERIREEYRALLAVGIQ